MQGPLPIQDNKKTERGNTSKNQARLNLQTILNHSRLYVKEDHNVKVIVTTSYSHL
jgi:hypothetical protein